MVKSVSNILFGNKSKTMDKVSQKQLETPGAYSGPESMPPVYRKGIGFLDFLARAFLAAIIVCTGAVIARRYVPTLSEIDTLQEFPKKAKLIEQIKYDFAKFADWLKKIPSIFSLK